MIQGKSLLGIVPARGGSKGVDRKNIINIHRKPLIAWTIEAAKASKYLDNLILSSDDDEIISIALKLGCHVPFKRPDRLATDECGISEVLVHAINNVEHEYDYIVLLQPTSPLRSAEDIDGCIECCVNNGAPTCVSIVEANKSPYWMYTVNENSSITPILTSPKNDIRRQELPEVYILNGAVYVSEVNYFLENRMLVDSKTIGYVMPKSRSLDIDSDLDIITFKSLLNLQVK
jgi:CMP-N,N'-diacetyllegionaminic acid synthase